MLYPHSKLKSRVVHRKSERLHTQVFHLSSLSLVDGSLSSVAATAESERHEAWLQLSGALTKRVTRTQFNRG